MLLFVKHTMVRKSLCASISLLMDILVFSITGLWWIGTWYHQWTDASIVCWLCSVKFLLRSIITILLGGSTFTLLVRFCDFHSDHKFYILMTDIFRLYSLQIVTSFVIAYLFFLIAYHFPMIVLKFLSSCGLCEYPCVYMWRNPQIPKEDVISSGARVTEGF